MKMNDGWYVINGETKPGVRSAKVYKGRMHVQPAFGLLNWIFLMIYLGGMLYLGYFFMRKEGSTDDFFKGGERIPWWAAGMSIFATMLKCYNFYGYTCQNLCDRLEVFYDGNYNLRDGYTCCKVLFTFLQKTERHQRL